VDFSGIKCLLKCSEWELVFYGSHSINMDIKGRIAIPARVRESLQECGRGRVVVTAHTENRCLHVFPEPQWLEILPTIESLPVLIRYRAALNYY
jgi:DNA-binding transcriptional regulator/RsmH inhibitor MraZ